MSRENEIHMARGRAEHILALYERDVLREGDRNVATEHLIRCLLNDLDHLCGWHVANGRVKYNLRKLLAEAEHMDTPEAKFRR